ncbi:transmembrane protein 160 [Tachyglossus aculeatus]|uniref:transmembrane protein 160 n=1 Tax=Tachyglossus aculeatus TaxID=9261 RepID=UPI0018F411FB|nr:transmembrane protein 160 [Tachyglossus aculeatus]
MGVGGACGRWCWWWRGGGGRALRLARRLGGPPLPPPRRGVRGPGGSGPGPGPGPRAGPAPPAPVSELDRADAWLLRKAHETAFLSWFRNGLLASGIGVLSYVQSDVGREAAYGFFFLGGVCVAYGGASYLTGLVSLRQCMRLTAGGAVSRCAAVGSVALFWACAVCLYLGQLELEVELVPDDGADDYPAGEDDGGPPDK